MELPIEHTLRNSLRDPELAKYEARVPPAVRCDHQSEQDFQLIKGRDIGRQEGFDGCRNLIGSHFSERP